MKILPVVVAYWVLVALVGANDVHRTYDNDHQHKRAKRPSEINTRQTVGYEEIETTSEFWHEQAQKTLKAKLAEEPIVAKAKNVILFIGDGMSPQTIAATRMYLGNENNVLSFERFPYLGTARPYCVNRQVADSACSASAYLSGVKTNYGMINVAPHVPRYNCEYNRTEAEFLGLMEWAQDSAKGTGIVTNTPITDASPAGAYASIASRDWENDAKVIEDGCDPKEYPDIAHQLIHGDVGKKLNIIFGGGRQNFRPTSELDENENSGARTDNRNLIEEWRELHPNKAEYIYNKIGLKAVDTDQTEHLLGLFQTDYLYYNLEIEQMGLHETEPKLWELVDVAIGMLNKSENGYVLFVEGGRIDNAHHGTRARLALDETAQLSEAIDFARKATSVEDTLIVVSADHSHTMTFNGYQKRGSDILGIADISDEDGLPYTTLSYANGGGYYDTYTEQNRAIRVDISDWNLTDYNARYLATVPMGLETHGGEDVAVYASGPMAHMFQGNFEQNTIPHLISFAAKIGHYKESKDETGAGSSLVGCVQLTLVCGFVVLLGMLKWKPIDCLL
ncbi:membrane-bound alkaline phosphatase-like [Topomyia yanbarensis]|uniref:membrane-bound alkaline phosphatase-like n=1 Tax=Topomyia yanbarensis TaxID=2498891 RepID=UPI00273C2A5E|nr:membrane-bound alkaline phosphatase-like [Topomyia yanbarensis]